jgi:hypothetical protein
VLLGTVKSKIPIRNYFYQQNILLDLNAYRIITGLDPPEKVDNIAELSPKNDVSSKTPLNRVVDRVWKATSDNMAGIRNEGARVVGNIIRTCHVKGGRFIFFFKTHIFLMFKIFLLVSPTIYSNGC